MPSAIVIGGLYAPGRHLIAYLVENSLASPIRCVDRSIPQVSYLSPEHEAAFAKVECVQSSMLTPELAQRALHKDGVAWDYIFFFNLESKLGLPEQAYEYGKRRPAMHTAEYALQHGSVMVIESSAASHIPLPPDKYATEDTPCLYPRHGHAFRCTLKTEEELRQMEGLKLVVMREAIPYGPDFYVGFATIFVLARIFKEQGEPYYDQFRADRRLSCIHVRDIARAYWHVADTYHQLDKPVRIYNLACPDKFTNGRLVEMVTSYIGVPVRRMNAVAAKLAKLFLKLPGTLDRYNQHLIRTWLRMLEEQALETPPIMAYIDAELLDVQEVAIDGSLITRETGFEYAHPIVTTQLLSEGIEQLQRMNLFPQ